MVGSKVYVVQNLELGFDNVVAVYSAKDVNIETLILEYGGGNYHIEERIVQEFGVY